MGGSIVLHGDSGIHVLFVLKRMFVTHSAFPGSSLNFGWRGKSEFSTNVSEI